MTNKELILQCLKTQNPLASNKQIIDYVAKQRNLKTYSPKFIKGSAIKEARLLIEKEKALKLNPCFYYKNNSCTAPLYHRQKYVKPKNNKRCLNKCKKVFCWRNTPLKNPIDRLIEDLNNIQVIIKPKPERKRNKHG